MQPDTHALIARTEFYLCLSRALRSPLTPDDYQALIEILPGDLRDILSEAEYPGIEAGLAALKSAIDSHPHDPLELLKTYSKLFFIPPIRHSLNAGLHLDNALMGSHAIEITAFYAQHGVERSDNEHELTDHLCVQLEFVAMLLAQAIEHLEQGERQQADDKLAALRNFIGRYIAPWVGQLTTALAREIDELPLTGIYLALTGLVYDAIRTDLSWLDACYPNTQPIAEPQPVQPDIAVADVHSPEALQAIAARLKEAGLDTQHLHIA